VPSGCEPRNNAAEQSVRQVVQWRKPSYGSNGERGKAYAERMLTVTATAQLQGVNVAEYRCQALTTYWRKEAPPPRIPSRP